MKKPNRSARQRPGSTRAPRDPSTFPVWNQKLIALLAKRPDLTQTDLADEVAEFITNRRTVGKWFTDGNKPLGKRFMQISKALARVFRVDLLWLMTDEMGLPAPAAIPGPVAVDSSPRYDASAWGDPALLELLQAAATDAGAKAYLLGALDAYRQRHGPPRSAAPHTGRGTAADTTQP